MGIPDANIPMFILHLILAVLATAIWVLCSPIVDGGFPTHIQAWIVFELALSLAQTIYGALAAAIDARDTSFYERRAETFLIVDVVLMMMNVGTAVTGAIYWRNGSEDRQLIFDVVVILSWATLVTLAFIGFQDRAQTVSY
ncbi:hypothetical protein M885DRAFT_523933 [Pelagophyceae sp. CCMP2097]|nr:hypothetical protein M885DRAFT_523933 [Pelagophyceae sp. CCMP2097]